MRQKQKERKNKPVIAMCEKHEMSKEDKFGQPQKIKHSLKLKTKTRVGGNKKKKKKTSQKIFLFSLQASEQSEVELKTRRCYLVQDKYLFL